MAEVPVTFFGLRSTLFNPMAKEGLLNALYFVVLLLFANIVNQLCYVDEPAQMQGKVTRSSRSQQNLDLASHFLLVDDLRCGSVVTFCAPIRWCGL